MSYTSLHVLKCAGHVLSMWAYEFKYRIDLWTMSITTQVVVRAFDYMCSIWKIQVQSLVRTQTFIYSRIYTTSTDIYYVRYCIH